MTARFTRTWAVSLFLAFLAACGGTDEYSDVLEPEPSEIGTIEEPIDVTATMYYEGSCAWLACASVYCGNPGCGGTCSDTQPWVARPSTKVASCGSTVRVCNTNNGRCVDALVRDTSSSGVWEGNMAVFNAIGASYGDGTCNCAACTGINSCYGATYGWGQASVRVTDSTSTWVVVDDQSSGFTRYGPTQYWFEGYVGYNGHVWYTYANGSTLSNYARWKPALPSAGTYTVYAHIPSNYSNSEKAKYRIYHNGTNHYATINQNLYYNQWVSLGAYSFSANGTEYVELTDATGELLSSDKMIGFDAVKFVK